MKPVLRLLLLTLVAVLSSLFASPDTQAFSWKTAPDEIFSGTLEDAQQNGPSAREQCRINGWLNYDTASGYTVAARTTTRTNFNVYESLAEVPISGITRSTHRNAANRAFAQQLEGSPDLQRMFNQQLGGDVLQHMNSGAGRNLLNPPGAVWHHPIDNPGVLRLLRQGEHTNPLLQPVLHPGPNRTGGFGTHFGGN